MEVNQKAWLMVVNWRLDCVTISACGRPWVQPAGYFKSFYDDYWRFAGVRNSLSCQDRNHTIWSEWIAFQMGRIKKKKWKDNMTCLRVKGLDTGSDNVRYFVRV